jgi:hypothetical protein
LEKDRTRQEGGNGAANSKPKPQPEHQPKNHTRSKTQNRNQHTTHNTYHTHPKTHTTLQACGVLLKTLVASFVVTAAIWAFPYEAVGWEPTNEHVLYTVATPVLAYLVFFTWRATKTYLEIVAEEEEEEELEKGER